MNRRLHRGVRAVRAERLEQERRSMRALPERMPETARRLTLRVPPQPYLRRDTNDYSLDPGLAGRRVEVRISQAEISTFALDMGELACRHRALVRPPSDVHGARATASARDLRGERRREPEVELRPLHRYDALIPA